MNRIKITLRNVYGRETAAGTGRGGRTSCARWPIGCWPCQRLRSNGRVEMTTTNRDVTLIPWENIGLKQEIMIPAGTRCVLVDGPQGCAWAVDDVPLLVKLTGNSHDPKYRYVFLPLDAVGSTELPG